MSRFESVEQFREVIEKIFTLMNDHPEVGPRLNKARAPNRFEFTDLGLRFDVTYTGAEEAAAGRWLRWTWNGEGCDWEPVIRLTMPSDVANRYFQGKENVAMAVATGKIKVRGPVPKLLELGPVTRPIHALYREWLEDEGHDHLLA
jgi:hypothetical protein